MKLDDLDLLTFLPQRWLTLPDNLAQNPTKIVSVWKV